MKKFFTKLTSPKKGQKGFTLIELLIVIAILGILAAVAIPNIASFIKSGNISAANSEAAAVRTAAQAYMAENPNYDGNIDSTMYLDYMGGTGTTKADYLVDSNSFYMTLGTTNGWPSNIGFDETDQLWKSAELVSGS